MQAIYDIAFVGDNFLHKAMQPLRERINRSEMNQKDTKDRTYMQEYYNINDYYFSQSNLMPSSTSRLVNAAVEALNDRERFPRYMVIVMDKDLMDDLPDLQNNPVHDLAALVNWIGRQIDIMIRCKRLQLSEKRPGAVNQHDPTVILVTMLRRALSFQERSRMADVCKLRIKFNELLNEKAARQNFRVSSIKSCTSIEHFDRMGNLSTKGIRNFWEEFNDLLDRFDANKVKLLPRSKKTQMGTPTAWRKDDSHQSWQYNQHHKVYQAYSFSDNFY